MKKYLYISKGFSNSEPLTRLLTGYEPMMWCQKDVFDVPNDLRVLPGNTYKDLGKSVVEHKSIIEMLSREEGELIVKNFLNTGLWDEIYTIPNVKLLGMDSETVHKLDNKVIMYSDLQNIVPLPNHIITDKEKAEENFESIKSNKGVYTATGTGGGSGEGSGIHQSIESLKTYLTQLQDDEPIVMVEALDIKSCPSIDVIIANENEIITHGITELQLNGLATIGAQHPTVYSAHKKEEITEMAQTIGKYLAEQGVRGYINIDMNLDQNDNLYFGEINPRYGAISAERILMQEAQRQTNQPTLMDLEKMALEQGTFGTYTMYPTDKIEWACQNINITPTQVQRNYNQKDEIQAFKQNGIALVGQPKAGTTAKYLGKLVVVGPQARNIKTIGQKVATYMVGQQQ